MSVLNPMLRGMTLILIGLLSSCAAETPSESGIDEAGAIAVARREVKARETWADRASYSATRTEDGWMIFAVRKGDRPADPYDPVLREPNCMVVVDRQGKVTMYGWGKVSPK